MNKKKILIVGGVAGGATAAAHARRMSEEAEIIIFEKGPHVSFANCGLPYYVGGEISDKEDLLVQTPEGLRSRFNLDVRIFSEAISIDPAIQKIEIFNSASGEKYWETYDDLILSTGAVPLKPPIPGIDLPGHFTVRNIPDIEAINGWISKHDCRNAVVVGGGFIGLEMVEQLHRRGLKVTVVEALPQVMAPLDPEIAAWLHLKLRDNNVDLYLDDPVAKFETPKSGEAAHASIIELKNGLRIPADIVILGLGVRPKIKLGQDAGLEIGEKGGFRVNDFLQSSIPHIWAIGDAIEVRHFVTGDWTLIPLAGPANRQGRIVAENIFGNSMPYSGTCGTSILRLFDLTVTSTGANEKSLKAANIPYEAVHMHPPSHATYYPEAHPLTMKILINSQSGKLLGAQMIGQEGVDKRIDVFATALKAGMTVHDLEDLELAYAPPFGSAKDPINLAGMVGQHIIKGEIKHCQWYEVAKLDPQKTIVLDVRDDDEREEGFIPGSLHIPLPQLRERFNELPKDREIVAYCQSGQRSYFASRFLAQKDFKVRNLTGAYRTWKVAMNQEKNP